MRVRLTLNQPLQRPRELAQFDERHVEQMPERLMPVPSTERDQIPDGLDALHDRRLCVRGDEPGEV